MARKDAFKQINETVDSSGRCTVHADQDRCFFPGSMSDSTHGGDWICRLHFKCPPEVVIPVIEESKIWYELSRNGHEVPKTYKRFDGVLVPGYRTRRARGLSLVAAKPVAGS